MSDRPPVVRVPTHRPLTPAQLAAVELIGGGWPEQDVARMLGVSIDTVRYHIDVAALKMPGDLRPLRLRAIAWWRGAPIEVLQSTPLPSRQEAITSALGKWEGRGCPSCGYDGVQRRIDPDGETERHPGSA